MLISSLTACPPHRRSRDGRQDLLREALELCLLVVADEADAEIGHAGVRVALQRADRVLDQLDAVAAVRDRLPAPEHPPDVDVLFQPLHTSLVLHAARRPLPFGGRQAPAHTKPENDASARQRVHVRDLVREHHRLPEGGEEHRGAEPHARRHRGQVRERGERLEPRLGDDAITDPGRVVPRLVGVARHRPALLDGWPPGRLHDGATRGHEDTDAHQADRTQPPCTGWCEHRNSTNAGRPFAFSSSARLSAGTISDGLSTSSLWKPTALAIEAMHAFAWSETFHV